jgi:hypothetical protein
VFVERAPQAQAVTMRKSPGSDFVCRQTRSEKCPVKTTSPTQTVV